MVCVQDQARGGVCPNAKENGQIRLPRLPSGRVQWCHSSRYCAPVLQEGRKTANIHVNLSSSAESRFKMA